MRTGATPSQICTIMPKLPYNTGLDFEMRTRNGRVGCCLLESYYNLIRHSPEFDTSRAEGCEAPRASFRGDEATNLRSSCPCKYFFRCSSSDSILLTSRESVERVFWLDVKHSLEGRPEM